MQVGNWTKLATLVIVAAGAIFLGFYDKIDSQAVVALLSAALGYVFGNGHGVLEAQRFQSQIQRNPQGGL